MSSRRSSLRGGVWSASRCVAGLCALLLASCGGPAPTSKAPPNKNDLAQTEEFPWYVGFFRGAGREKLALLPDGRMIYAPLYLGTYTVKGNDLTFTSSSGDVTKQGTLTQEKDAVHISLDGQESTLKREVSFSRYHTAGAQREASLPLLFGTWQKVAQAGAPLADWQKASDALGPSLASDELLTFAAPDTLTQVVGGVSRQEKFALEAQLLLRNPESAGYQLKQELRLFSEHIELGPQDAPDVYVKQKAAQE